MTLETVSRYQRGQVADVGDRAVVVGGSIAGLLTARVLADGFDEVTILERDSLPDEPGARRGVPQGRHVHVLQEAGRATLEDLLPGFGEELISAGALMIDGLSDFRHHEQGDFLADGPRRVPMYCATRPLLEHLVRRRVTDADPVEVRAGCRRTDYLVDDATQTVEGVVVRDDDGGVDDVPADLVVDATGRTSQTPAWLEEHGYEPPDVDEVHIDVRYSTVRIERPPDDRRAFFVPPEPPRARGAGMFPIEGDRWVATLFGMHGDHPPADPDGLCEFAATLPITELERLLDEQPWNSDGVAQYPFPSNRRRRFERLDRFPDGLLVVGDAVASFNPIYGQGMSVAALEALVLHHALADGDRDDLPLRFFDRAEPVVDVPWSIAVGGDFAFPQTEGPKPRGTDFFNRYLDRLVRKAHTNGDLRDALIRVFMMERPPSSLLRPGVAWQVVRPTRADLGTVPRPGSGIQSGKTP
ncbi:FAD-dependent oxidoreductase [Halomicrobium salinisoli]|uniref:FAD-dependent oxidoreductase n=1 Tax=Halomicrobium salinisoli TaxID=2878391 RepID=UPI001CF0431F|nr:FAD-dependent monooxygenase [Halomicrobium salinisoli]